MFIILSLHSSFFSISSPWGLAYGLAKQSGPWFVINRPIFRFNMVSVKNTLLIFFLEESSSQCIILVHLSFGHAMNFFRENEI